MIRIHPRWRHAEPFAIYRNPDSRDRLALFADSDAVRFIYTGRSLYVGDANTFLHGDGHTYLVNFFDANSRWDGELFLTRRATPTTLTFLQPNLPPESIVCELSPHGHAGLIRMSNWHERERGILDQSLLWRQFTVGMQLSFPSINPLPGLTANEKVTSSTRAYAVLHGDGHLYFFDRDIDRFEMLAQLAEVERNHYGEKFIRTSSPIIGMEFGGNGNLNFDFSETSSPVEFLLDNRNVRACLGDQLDYEITRTEVSCMTKRVSNKSAAEEDIEIIGERQ